MFHCSELLCADSHNGRLQLASVCPCVCLTCCRLACGCRRARTTAVCVCVGNSIKAAPAQLDGRNKRPRRLASRRQSLRCASKRKQILNPSSPAAAAAAACAVCVANTKLAECVAVVVVVHCQRLRQQQSKPAASVMLAFEFDADNRSSCHLLLHLNLKPASLCR